MAERQDQVGPRAGRAAPQPLPPTLRASLNFARCDSESAALGPGWRRRRKRRGSRVEMEIGVGPAGGGGEVHPSRQPGLFSLQSHLCLVTALGVKKHSLLSQGILKTLISPPVKSKQCLSIKTTHFIPILGGWLRNKGQQTSQAPKGRRERS